MTYSIKKERKKNVEISPGHCVILDILLAECEAMSSASRGKLTKLSINILQGSAGVMLRIGSLFFFFVLFVVFACIQNVHLFANLLFLVSFFFQAVFVKKVLLCASLPLRFPSSFQFFPLPSISILIQAPSLCNFLSTSSFCLFPSFPIHFNWTCIIIE